jgi:hypothetical protein
MKKLRAQQPGAAQRDRQGQAHAREEDQLVQRVGRPQLRADRRLRLLAVSSPSPTTANARRAPIGARLVTFAERWFDIPEGTIQNPKRRNGNITRARFAIAIRARRVAGWSIRVSHSSNRSPPIPCSRAGLLEHFSSTSSQRRLHPNDRRKLASGRRCLLLAAVRASHQARDRTGMIHLYDGNNVMLRDLDKIGRERIGLRRRYELSNTGMHLWCWDGRNHNLRRRVLYPAYKMNRTPMAEDRFAQIGVFREALTHSSCFQVECEGWEADDVIGALVHRFVCKGLQVTVHTNDLDYWQLMQYRTSRSTASASRRCPIASRTTFPCTRRWSAISRTTSSGCRASDRRAGTPLRRPIARSCFRARSKIDNAEIIHRSNCHTTGPRNLLLNSEKRAEARVRFPSPVSSRPRVRTGRRHQARRPQPRSRERPLQKVLYLTYDEIIDRARARGCRTLAPLGRSSSR